MKLVEIYTSVQGEGPHTGKPIQFVRFGGCNYRCAGWPCDTQFAIDPQFRKQWESITPDEILRRLEGWPEHICMTGGEPLIQPSKDLEQFVYGLPRSYRVDLFTNGSRALPPWAHQSNVSIIMDWKLKGSGECPDEAMRKANLKQLSNKDAVKFVVADPLDLDEALSWSKHFYAWGVHVPIWAGVVWDKFKTSDLVIYILENQLPWRLNVQTHNYVWSPQERGR
jgi:7-carboxy-7-deazaguanine synthase